MTSQPVKVPTIPIPFHKLMKIVAIVDRNDMQTKELLEQLAAERYVVEVTDSFDRDVSEDASVGAYIALVDGERIENARRLAEAVREAGFETPLWALADSHRIADLAVLTGIGEVAGYIYLGQQTPTFYAKQVIASVVRYGLSLLPPFFGGLMAYDSRGEHRFRLPRAPGRAVLPQIPRRPAVLQAFRRGHLPQRSLQCRRQARRSLDPRRTGRRRAEACRAGVRCRSDVLRSERHEHVEQGRHRRRAQARRSRAVRSQQPQVDAPGRARDGGCDPDLPADRTQCVRHDWRSRLGSVGRGVPA